MNTVDTTLSMPNGYDPAFDRDAAIKFLYQCRNGSDQPVMPGVFERQTDEKLRALVMQANAPSPPAAAPEPDVEGWLATGHTRMANRLVIDSTVSVHARLLYQCLSMHAWQKSYCIVGENILAGYLGVKERQVRTYRRELEEAGWIETIHRGRNHTNRYNLLHVVPRPATTKRNG